MPTHHKNATQGQIGARCYWMDERGMYVMCGEAKMEATWKKNARSVQGVATHCHCDPCLPFRALDGGRATRRPHNAVGVDVVEKVLVCHSTFLFLWVRSEQRRTPGL